MRRQRFAKVYTSILTNERVADLLHRRNGDRAFRVYVFGLAWCAEHLTDGEIPRAIVHRVLDGKREDSELLVFVGLWERTEAGYSIPGYLEMNRSRDEIERRGRTYARNACERHMRAGHECSCGEHDRTVINIDREAEK